MGAVREARRGGQDGRETGRIVLALALQRGHRFLGRRYPQLRLFLELKCSARVASLEQGSWKEMGAEGGGRRCFKPQRGGEFGWFLGVRAHL